MKCPTCKDVNLVMSERQGIEIDYCPECRGIWLDRGELDKIIERSTSEPVADQNRERHKNRPQDHDKEDYRYKKKKRESFLGDLFDF
jgi:uncharacterized protein